jgi:hypothetical protein
LDGREFHYSAAAVSLTRFVRSQTDDNQTRHLEDRSAGRLVGDYAVTLPKEASTGSDCDRERPPPQRACRTLRACLVTASAAERPPWHTVAVAVDRDRAVRPNPAHGFTALPKRWPAVEVAQRRRLVPFETHHRRLAGRAVHPTSAISRIHPSRCAPNAAQLSKKYGRLWRLRLTKPTSHFPSPDFSYPVEDLNGNHGGPR